MKAVVDPCAGGTESRSRRFLYMIEATQQILERSFRIAWDYLEATGELGDPHTAACFLRDTILSMMQRGEYRPRLISNRTIDAYNRRTERSCALVS